MVIKNYASNAFAETLCVNNNNFNKCLDELWFYYINYSENELFEVVTSNNSAYSKAITNNSNIINDSDILSVEIIINEKILERAKILKNNLGFNGR